MENHRRGLGFRLPAAPEGGSRASPPHRPTHPTDTSRSNLAAKPGTGVITDGCAPPAASTCPGCARRCQILPRYRFEFQSNLVWDLIKPISNFCFQFNTHKLSEFNKMGPLMQ
jgi:hypothetical protein